MHVKEDICIATLTEMCMDVVVVVVGVRACGHGGSRAGIVVAVRACPGGSRAGIVVAVRACGHAGMRACGHAGVRPCGHECVA